MSLRYNTTWAKLDRWDRELTRDLTRLAIQKTQQKEPITVEWIERKCTCCTPMHGFTPLPVKTAVTLATGWLEQFAPKSNMQKMHNENPYLGKTVQVPFYGRGVVTGFQHGFIVVELTFPCKMVWGTRKFEVLD